MDCDRARDLLSDYLDEELPEEVRATVSAHLDSCSRCAAEAEELVRTLAVLSGLPGEPAPPELLDRVMAAIARETAPAAGAPRKTLARARFRFPLEAAAAVFLVVLVYGLQKAMPPGSALPGRGERPPAAATTPRDDAPALPGPPAAAKGATKEPRAREKEAAREPRSLAKAAKDAPATAEGTSRETSRAADETASAAAPAARNALAEAAGQTSRPPAGIPGVREEDSAGHAAPGLAAAPSFALAPAARVSSAEETIRPKIYAAPPSRVLAPIPYGREVTLEVTVAGRAGVEERITAAAERFGGRVPPAGDAHPPVPGTVRVHLPADAADAFLGALADLGTVPPRELAAATDFPAGPAPGIVAYTVRIRVR